MESPPLSREHAATRAPRRGTIHIDTGEEKAGMEQVTDEMAGNRAGSTAGNADGSTAAGMAAGTRAETTGNAARDEADGAATLSVLVIGAGFAGVGLGVALRREGIRDFLILEKGRSVGGVWRDNRYPGAACDVPSHLYSFSFEPNPGWSHVFSRQHEIAAYIERCVQRHGLEPHLRFGAEVLAARYDEDASLWRVDLADGRRLSTRVLVSAVGQLSRPALPRIEGLDRFRGPSFHSAQWDESCALDGKRVAVIGTGASAIQFVPAIAPRVGHLSVFQRSASWILPRPDRAYRPWEQALFARFPALMRLHRLGIYLRYEARALAFTRFRSLLEPAAGGPFRRLLARQVADPALRDKLMPDYPIGCKRILLSSDYLPTMTRPNVELVTTGIRRVCPEGIETEDGRVHEADVIVYGTGFAATEFLAPMRITGRDGLDLNRAWSRGAEAYLGLSVPGFPNFFMLYGPNTNLGHNSIIYMLESQISHVLRCLRLLRRRGAETIEVGADSFTRFNRHVRQRLQHTAWNGCKSWYVDANGHNSTNWPGFTLSYRWQVRYGSLRAYRLGRRLGGRVSGQEVLEPAEPLERLTAAGLRLLLRGTFRPFIGTPFPVGLQRALVSALAMLMPGRRDIQRHRLQGPGLCAAEQVVPPQALDGAGILYLHGGAFCLGSPGTHRAVTTRLAAASGLRIWVPDYRLAPEHPYPAAVDDALGWYRALLAQGYAPGRLVVAGDSAGGALALALARRLLPQERPAALALISPVTDPELDGDSLHSRRLHDPMIRANWLRQGLAWYGAPAGDGPLGHDLGALPPLAIQVGDDEILLSDSLRLAATARASGVPTRLEVHAGRWHVFHLQSAYLRSAREALAGLGRYCRRRVDAAVS